MQLDERFEDLLVHLEELVEADPTRSVSDYLHNDRTLAAAIERDPDLFDRLHSGIEMLKNANKNLGVDLDPEPVPVIPGFCGLQEIARGGMGIVYRAQQPSLDRTVAIKLMLSGRFSGAVLRARFRNEMQAAARLRHPNIVEVYEVGETKGIDYGCFEFLSGQNLAEKIAGRPVAEREAAEMVATLARAVEHAHQQGIVHRDLKPSNIRFTEGGVIKITDFGLAKDLRNQDNLTQTGETPGSPSYMSPEQVRGTGVDRSTDIYALGATLYELLTGRPPFLGGTSVETLVQVTKTDPVPPRYFRDTISSDLEAVCLKCLEKDPTKRYASAAELAEDLDRWLDGKVTLARPASAVHRAIKLCRRRPYAASGLVALGLAILTLAMAGWWHGNEMKKAYQQASLLRDDAIKHRDLALVKEEEAIASANAAIAEKQRNEQLLYSARVWRTYEAWKLDAMASFHSLRKELDAFQLPDHEALFAQRYLDHLTDLAEVKIYNGDSPLLTAVFVDDDTIATGNEAGNVRLWQLSSGKFLAELGGHTSCINSLDVSPDGKFLASGSCDHTILEWNLTDLTLQQSIEWDHGRVGTTRYSKDGQSLITYGLDHAVTLWDRASGRSIAEDIRADSGFLCTALSPDGTWTVVSRRNGNFQWWTHSDPSDIQTHLFPTPIAAMAFNHSGSQLVAVETGGQSWVMDFQKGTVSPPFVNSSDSKVLAFSSDDKLLAISGTDSVIRVWNVANRQLLHKLKGHDSSVNEVRFSPSNDRIVASMQNGEAWVWRLDGAARGYQDANIKIQTSISQPKTLSPHGKWVAVAHQDGSIELQGIESPGEPIKLPGRDRSVLHHLRFLDDGMMLLALGPEDDGWCRVWALSHDAPQLHTEITGFNSFDITISGSRRASRGTTDNELVIEPFSSTAQELRFAFPSDVTLCKFDSQGRSAAITTESAVYLWNLSAQAPELVSRNSVGRARHCAFSSDDSVFAISNGNEIVLFRSSDRSELGVLRGHTADVSSLTFSPDGRLLASGADDHTVRLWHTATAQEMMTLEGHHLPVNAVCFNSTGDTLYSLSEDNQGTISVLCWTAPN